MKLPKIEIKEVKIKYTAIYIIIAASTLLGLHIFTNVSVYENAQYFGYLILFLLMILGLEFLVSIKKQNN